jgi:nucleoside-diphosphate-sugar epimerase
MDDNQKIACVTGASGMIGRRIVQRLIIDGYKVRALSREKYFNDPRVDFVNGGLDDEEILKRLVHSGHLLFHCAAELYDESKMWEVNVIGTERLLRIVEKSDIRYLCYVSSAGVVGRTHTQWVDEKIQCNPQNAYERSKWAAEQLVMQGIDGCQIVVLRPTNVIDEERPGALSLPMDSSWLNRFKVFLKGGECAHIVHADDVADAALFFVSRLFDRPQCFFVSCDHEALNTIGGLWTLCNAVKNNRSLNTVRPVAHLPLIVPHILRTLCRGRSNRGDVRYSSEKLLSEGFHFSRGVVGAVKAIVSKQVLGRA